VTDLNPFDRTNQCKLGEAKCGRCGCALPGKSSASYTGSKALNELYANAKPMLLVRTNPLLSCSCVNLQSGTGDQTCTRCFGLGKVVIALERFGCYVSSTSPDYSSNLSSSGLDRAFVKTLFMHRMVSPKEGQLVLDVQWNVANNDVYNKAGVVVAINNAMMLKFVDFVGFNDISYIKAMAVASNDRIPYLTQLIKNNNASLHPYVNRTVVESNNLRKAATELCSRCM
jgi:hypothetical protein